jgi:hypothetical protein
MGDPSVTSLIDDTSKSPLSSSTMKSTDAICNHTIQDQSNIINKQNHSENVLKSLHQYYSKSQTKRKLNMNLQAGFRQDSTIQRNYKEFLPPDTSSKPVPTSDDFHLLSTFSESLPDDTEVDLTSTEPPTPVTNQSVSAPVPILRCVDKPSTTLPSRLTFTEDYIRASMGFRRVETIKRHLKSLYGLTVILDSCPPDAVLYAGDFATLHKSPRNTTPVVRPTSFGDVIHMDIIFGPAISLGNIHYGLLFTDRYSRMTYIYPLHNLTSDIHKQLEAFFAHLGFSPKRLITDFDTKLIGGKAREFLNSLSIHVNAAPAYRQDKNGLAERHWQTVVAMARNWLASAELPTTFWYYAVKRATEVCNYFPTLLSCCTWTTLLEMAHGKKPDLRVLFKLFSVAAVRRERHGDSQVGKFDSQSVPMIAIGRCPNSNSIQFFNPANGTFVSSVDYMCQYNVSSGAYFGMKYQPGTFIYRLDESTTVFTPKFPIDSTVHVHTHSPPSTATIIGLPSYDAPSVYTVSFRDGSVLEYTDNLLSLVPDDNLPTQPSLLPSWIQGGCQCNPIS